VSSPTSRSADIPVALSLQDLARLKMLIDQAKTTLDSVRGG